MLIRPKGLLTVLLARQILGVLAQTPVADRTGIQLESYVATTTPDPEPAQ